MKKLFALSCLLSLVVAIGCGVEATDPSKATGPAPAQEQHEADIQKAMDSGAIDPSTYGRQ